LGLGTTFFAIDARTGPAEAPDEPLPAPLGAPAPKSRAVLEIARVNAGLPPCRVKSASRPGAAISPLAPARRAATLLLTIGASAL
jgi:hypothetical protein